MTRVVESVEQMLKLAGDFAESVRSGDVLALEGPLGAGKTHFTKGLAAALGYDGLVTSPTFSLVQEYLGGRMPVYHLDFYRLDTAEEAIAGGVLEYLPSDGLTVVEWASRFPDLLPPEAKWIAISILPETQRGVTFEDAGH